MSLRLKWSWMLVGTGLAVCGCHKKPTPTPQANDGGTSVNPMPATMPSVASITTRPATGPTTVPAAEPAYTYLLIGDKLNQFPPARVRVLRNDDQVSLVLYTADPVTAIDNDYQGNSFYFTMPLTDVRDTPGTFSGTWRYKSGTSDYQETTEGIFLKGLRTHLQSSDVMVRVQQIGPAYQIQVAGQFQAFETSNLQMPGVLTNVTGEILATTEVKK